MGCFGCFHGSSKSVKDEDALLPWAPLPGEGSRGPTRGWRGARGGTLRAPAFGQGALREDPWAPKFQHPSPTKRTTGRTHYDPFAESAAVASARLAPPSPPAQPARTPFAASAAPAAEGGWQSEPGWVHERAQALAAEAAAAAAAAHGDGKPKGGSGSGGVLGHLFTRQRSGGENDVASRLDSAGYGGGGISLKDPAQPPKVRQASRQKKHKAGQEQLLPRAPAFGQGALTKWH